MRSGCGSPRDCGQPAAETHPASHTGTSSSTAQAPAAQTPPSGKPAAEKSLQPPPAQSSKPALDSWIPSPNLLQPIATRAQSIAFLQSRLDTPLTIEVRKNLETKV